MESVNYVTEMGGWNRLAQAHRDAPDEGAERAGRETPGYDWRMVVCRGDIVPLVSGRRS